MKILVESGSTKTDWVVIGNSQIIKQITTIGYNPYYYEINVLDTIIENEVLPQVNPDGINNIYYYGSGCSTVKNCNKVAKALSRAYPSCGISVNHDLTGAAVGLLGHNEGIACILGTGSNSCDWNGIEIINNMPSAGYLLADEGSGTYLGMKILKGILEEKAPVEIIKKYYAQYETNFEEVLSTIYDSQQPNRFFAEISKFAGQNISNVWIQEKIIENFNDFIENSISQYPEYKSKTIAFTGAVAFHFQELLIKALTNAGLNIGKITKTPMEGLIEFHQL